MGFVVLFFFCLEVHQTEDLQVKIYFIDVGKMMKVQKEGEILTVWFKSTDNAEENEAMAQ